MPLPTRADQLLYGQVLTEIKMRLREVQDFLTFPVEDGRATISGHRLEYAALHLRTSIEFVALSSLVANRPEVEQVATAFHKKDADAAAKIVKRLNPHYWPKPVRLVIPPDRRPPWVLEPVTEGFLREEDWRAEWGYLSSLLHAPNPYRVTPSQPRPDLGTLATRLGDIHDRLARLLFRHQVTLLDQNVVLTALMNAKGDGLVHVQGAIRKEPQ